VQRAEPGCEIASIHAVFRGFARGKSCFGCVREEIPAVQIGGSGAWFLIAPQASAADAAIDFAALAARLKPHSLQNKVKPGELH
jgi:hypothetical protein